MVSTNNIKSRDRESAVRQILKLSDRIFRELKLTIPAEWLTSEMTVAQLRVLLFLYTEGSSSMHSIAGSLGVAISTTTGIIDKLVKKDLVTRSEDNEDRRLVVCSLSPAGHKLLDRIWALGRVQMKAMLEGLTMEQLIKAMEVGEFILSSVESNREKPIKDAGRLEQGK